MVEVKKIAPEESQKVWDLLLEAYSTSSPSLSTTGEEWKATPIDHLQQRLISTEIFLGAYENQELVGLLNCAPLVGSLHMHRCSLTDLYVTASHHGQGIGSQLVQELVRHCRDSSIYRWVEAEVESSNQLAVQLFENLSFQKQATLVQARYYESKYYDLNVYRRSL